MLLKKKSPKHNKAAQENLTTQPLKEFKAFNQPYVVTEGWYPFCKSSDIKAGQAQSFVVLQQRIVVYRGEDNQLRAMDGFCPHMGADLGHGTVKGNELQCYFHHWRFAVDGSLAKAPCAAQTPKGVRQNTYPVQDKYGFIWVYAAAQAPEGVCHPPTLEKHDLASLYLGEFELYAHHHVMMVNGIDLQHFSTVHGFDIQFDFSVNNETSHRFDWSLKGELPAKRQLKYRLARWLLGNHFEYVARFAGGSVVTLTYGPKQRFRGRGRLLPSLSILWGCVPLATGVSRVHAFMVTRKRPGLLGVVKTGILYTLTLALLYLLKHDDEKAIPNIRFSAGHLSKEDASVARFIQLTDKLPISTWTNRHENPQTNT